MERDLPQYAARRVTRPRRRPPGVSVIAGVQAVHVTAVALSWHIPLGAWFGLEAQRDIDIVGRAVAIAAGLAIAVGLWRLQRWAWVAAMLWVGANMAAALYAFFVDRPPYLVMALSIAVVWYLNQSDVQRAFRADDAPENGDR
ncbi:MAG: hypothetical protein U0531_14930 [Dehalococcoidia bacterium]